MLLLIQACNWSRSVAKTCKRSIDTNDVILCLLRACSGDLRRRRMPRC